MHRFRNESGAILIHTMIVMLVLIGFMGMVFDHGVLNVSRGQAQNTADAAALAGTVARAFDEPNANPPASGGVTEQSIQYLVGNHLIAGNVTHRANWNWVCPPNVPANSKCVRVNVYRDGTAGSSRLPVFFGAAFGLTEQNTRAMAIGAASPASGSNCLKPWLIPDKFTDVNMDGDFDLPDPVTGLGGDIYVNPGWTLADIGTPLLLNPGSPQQAAAPSMFYQIDVNHYYDDIVSCTLQAAIGASGEIDTAPGLSNGITHSGVDELIKDGPVTVVIGMFSPVEFETNRQTGHYDMHIVNMMGFRIEGMTGNALYGTIVGGPGELMTGGITPGPSAGFLQVIRLVR